MTGRPKAGETKQYHVELISTQHLERMEEIYLSALRSTAFNDSERRRARRYLSAVQSELRCRYSNPTTIDNLADLWEETQGQREVA
jgi:hypothetical protein